MSSVNRPITIEHILKPVSAQEMSIVVLNNIVKNKKIRYTYSIILAGSELANPSLEGIVALMKTLNTAKNDPTITNDKTIWMTM
jgi:hypothetical protein